MPECLKGGRGLGLERLEVFGLGSGLWPYIGIYRAIYTHVYIGFRNSLNQLIIRVFQGTCFVRVHNRWLGRIYSSLGILEYHSGGMESFLELRAYLITSSKSQSYHRSPRSGASSHSWSSGFEETLASRYIGFN